MKNITLIIVATLLSLSIQAQTTWTNAKDLTIAGHGPWSSDTPYQRLPSTLKGATRKALWNLGTNSSGIYIGFATNSSKVSVNWKLSGDNSMDHMTSVAIKGLDLYFLNGSKWQYINSARPYSIDNTRTIISNMKSEMREYILYLPLYEGVESIKIGVDSLSTIQKPLIDLPNRTSNRPMVFYGSSIMQGACASRPGMSPTSILARMTGREAINLGFSGNAQLDIEIAQLLTQFDNPYCFVLDFVPNCSAELIGRNMQKFIKTIREKHPLTPIIVVENSYFPPAQLDQLALSEREAKNTILRTIFEQLHHSGDKNLYLVEGKELIGIDFEATVDGLHSTDLGFMRYAEVLYSIINKLEGASEN